MGSSRVEPAANELAAPAEPPVRMSRRETFVGEAIARQNSTATGWEFGQRNSIGLAQIYCPGHN